MRILTMFSSGLRLRARPRHRRGRRSPYGSDPVPASATAIDAPGSSPDLVAGLQGSAFAEGERPEAGCGESAAPESAAQVARGLADGLLGMLREGGVMDGQRLP